ncbi:MAG: hypothetical protein IMZ57_11070 [Acidobacteria bacterium]|nr:hypothetical protein [Acidobacteriota bacterium]
MKQKQESLLPTAGPELRLIRVAANVGAKSVAKLAGVHITILCAFERGDLKHPGKIAEILAAYKRLDEMPKRRNPPYHLGGSRAARPKINPPVRDKETKDLWTAERLQAHIRAFISENDLTILERGKTGQRQILISPDQVFELGATLLLACGHNVR